MGRQCLVDGRGGSGTVEGNGREGQVSTSRVVTVKTTSFTANLALQLGQRLL